MIVLNREWSMLYFKKVGVVCDHAGVRLKEKVCAFLKSLRVSAADLGTFEGEHISVDYPDFASLLATKVSSGELDGGIAICGTGIGMAISANKVAGVRAASIQNLEVVKLARLHNDLNILCLGARFLDEEQSFDLIKEWLHTPYEGGRHQKRLDKIIHLEQKK